MKRLRLKKDDIEFRQDKLEKAINKFSFQATIIFYASKLFNFFPQQIVCKSFVMTLVAWCFKLEVKAICQVGTSITLKRRKFKVLHTRQKKPRESPPDVLVSLIKFL